MKRKTIGIDCDGVIANYTQLVLDYTNQIYNTSYVEDDITDYELESVLGRDKVNKVMSIIEANKAIRQMKLHDNSQKFVKDLSELGDIIYVTAPYYSYERWCFERIGWLGEYFGAKNDQVIFTSGKQYVDFDIMIDDSVKMVNKILDNGKKVVMIERPWNKGHEVNCSRFNNYDGIVNYIKAM